MNFAYIVKKKYEIVILVGFLLLALTLELQVTLKSPIAFGDEGFHTRMSQYMAENKEYPVYNPIETTNLEKRGFTRPPLWELLESGIYSVVGFSEIIVKLLTPFIASVLTGLATYILVKKIYDEKVGIIASLITITFPAVVTYAVLFYVDILFTLYFALFAFSLILGIKNEDRKYLILSGLFGALAFLTKIVGVFLFMALALVFIYGLIKVKKDFRKLLKIYSLPLIVAVILVAPFLVRNLVYYETPLCTAPLDASKCDVSSYTPKYYFSKVIEEVGTNVGFLQFGIADYIRFAYGNIWFVGISLIGGIFLLWKKYQTNVLMGILTLVLLILFARLFDARTEDVARWTLGWSPIIATIIALYFSEVYSFLVKYNKYLGIVVILVVLFFGYTSLTQKLNIMSQVKQFSPLFFKACDWGRENLPQDALITTVWGHHTTYNCQRTVAPNLADFQLSNDVGFIREVAKDNGITHIFVQKFSIRNDPLQEGYTIDFVRLLENNPNEFKKVYENGLDLQQCLQQGGCDGNIIYEINLTT